MEDFQRGDLVRLKSGGPDMTIQRVIGETGAGLGSVVDGKFQIQGFKKGDVVCQWFEGNRVNSAAFPRESLQKSQTNNGT